MSRKVLIIIISAMILTLGIVLAINYSSLLEEKDNISDTSNNREESENQENINDQDENPKQDIVEVDEDEFAIGNVAPDFTLKSLEGEEVSLSDYRGKIVLINFWATWCKFCDQEMPDLDAIDKENDDVVVLAVDVSEELTKVKSYTDKGGYDFQVVLDSDGAISREYLVSALPTTYAVNKQGILMGGVPGMVTKPQIEQIIENVRAEQ